MTMFEGVLNAFLQSIVYCSRATNDKTITKLRARFLVPAAEQWQSDIL